MSVQHALRFLEALRADDVLRQRIAALDEGGLLTNLDPIVQVAAEVGFFFTAGELDTAHRFDWGMRWARFAGGSTISHGHG